MIRFIAIALIILGVCSAAWGGFTYKTRKKVFDVGPIQATREETHLISVTPLAGGLIVVAGICLLLSRKV
jgi:UDP-N-acetylmuramyl pentapeptide phosphotransferase/UDP-N-acetylglucosamine-1-phosphate transferase